MRRFALTTPLDELAAIFSASVAEGLEQRFRPSRDIAAPDTVLGVYQAGNHRELDSFRWAFIPPHSRRPPWHIHDVRAEDLAERPMYADAFVKRRLLFIADSFYLWKQRSRTNYVGYVFRDEEREPLAIAAIWNPWTGPNSIELVRSCAVLTTPADEETRPISERMPVVLTTDEYDGWLDPEIQDATVIQGLLRPEDRPVLRHSRIKGSTMRRV